MKNMATEHKVILFLIIVLIGAIFINQSINISTNKVLTSEVNKINKLIKNEEINFTGTIMYTIEDNLALNGEELSTNIKGTGIVYYDDNKDITIVLENYNKCAIKFADTDEVTVLNEKCPSYTLLQGAKINLSSSNDIYKLKDEYVYQGIDAKNYIVYNNEYWRIVSFSKKGIKIIQEYSMGTMAYNNKTDKTCTSKDGCNKYENSTVYNFLNKEYAPILIGLDKASWNVGKVIGTKLEDLITAEEDNTIKANVGLLTVSDYIKSIDGSCDSTEENIICTNDTYININENMWLMSANQKDDYQAWYVNKEGSIYLDATKAEKEVKPVVILNDNYKITSGFGTKENPYQITKIK